MKRKVKLSEMYRLIGNYLELHGDADVSSIATHCNASDQTQYTLNLCDLSKDTYDSIGDIKIKYEEL